MPINLITGYNVNINEKREANKSKPSHFSLVPHTIIMSKISLDDESDTEWMYDQKDYTYDDKDNIEENQMFN